MSPSTSQSATLSVEVGGDGVTGKKLWQFEFDAVSEDCATTFGTTKTKDWAITDGEIPCCLPKSCLDLHLNSCFHCEPGTVIQSRPECKEGPPACPAGEVVQLLNGLNGFVLTPSEL